MPSLKSAAHAAEVLNLHLFEVESVAGDMIDVKVLPNRYSDAASYYGIAKLLAGVLGAAHKVPKVLPPKPVVSKAVPVSIKSPKLCRRMTARYFEEVVVADSPKWLAEFLREHGLRSINNVVDITNYVTLLTGEPLHAFDFDRMEGGRLIIRPAKPGETVETLDDRVFELDPSVLVLADASEALDVAGIKGGKKAEIKSGTKRILLTAGTFDGGAIYKTARKLNLHTDASQRFSHHLSPTLAEMGSNLAAKLIVELTQAKAGKMTDNYPSPRKGATIPLNIERFEAVSGIKISASRAKEYLRRLGFVVKGSAAIAPETRTDIQTEEDLFEEIVNVYGYEHLPATPPTVSLRPARREGQSALKLRARDILAALGLTEVYLYSFVSEENLNKMGGADWWGATKLKNPVSREFEYLRPSLSLNLIKAANHNLRFRDDARIFEIGTVFVRRNGALEEDLMLGFAFASKNENPVLELKAVVAEFLRSMNATDFGFYDLQFDLGFLREGAALEIRSGKERLGYIGVPKAADGGKVAIAELFLDKLSDRSASEPKYRELERFPAVVRDASFAAEKKIRIGDLAATAENAASEMLRSVNLLDVYEPKGGLFGGGKRSVTLRFIFRLPNRTLTDDEVNKELEKIVEALKAKFGVEVR